MYRTLPGVVACQRLVIRHYADILTFGIVTSIWNIVERILTLLERVWLRSSVYCLCLIIIVLFITCRVERIVVVYMQTVSHKI